MASSGKPGKLCPLLASAGCKGRGLFPPARVSSRIPAFWGVRDLLVALRRHHKYDSGKRHGYRTISPDEVRTMDEIYRDIYSRIYDSARIEPNEELQLNSYWINQPVNSPLDAGTIRSMIDAAERETFAGRTQRLRPDAKVFLLINLLQIASHAVLTAVANNWQKLKLSDLKLWED